jgi:hypothetical protein
MNYGTKQSETKRDSKKGEEMALDSTRPKETKGNY